MGYIFSPFVMSRLNTRPQFIAALIISAVAQVSITLITDWVILCQSRELQSWPLTVLSIAMPTNTTKGHCTSGWDGPLSDNALPHTLLALPHHCRSSLLQLSKLVCKMYPFFHQVSPTAWVSGLFLLSPCRLFSPRWANRVCWLTENSISEINFLWKI